MNLYSAALVVRIHDKEIIAPGMTDGLAICFGVDSDHESALRNMVLSLKGRQLQFIDLHGEIVQLDQNKWDTYIKTKWPEFIARLPSQSDVVSYHDPTVFFGPVLSYNGDG